MQVANTLPGREQRRVPRAARRRHARLPADPAERGRHGLRRQGHGCRPALPADRRAGPARGLQALRADGPRRREDHGGGWSKRRQEHQARDPQLPAASRPRSRTRDKQLAALVDSANANFEAFASEEAVAARGAARCSRARSTRPSQTLTKTERAGRPSSAPRSSGCARSRATSPRRCARRSRSSARPRRSSATRSGPSRATCSRPCATCAPPPTTCAVVTPRLDAQLRSAEPLLQQLAYDPPGAAQAVPVLGAWGAHAGATMFDLQDAHGPVRRGIVLVSLQRLRRPRAGRSSATRSSALLTQLLNLPPEQRGLSQQPRHPTSSCRDQAGPQPRSDPHDGRLRAVRASASWSSCG